MYTRPTTYFSHTHITVITFIIRALHTADIPSNRKVSTCVISGFHREEAENCALLGYYVTSSGTFLPTFPDNLWSHLQGFLENGTTGKQLKPSCCNKIGGLVLLYEKTTATCERAEISIEVRQSWLG